MGQTSSASPVRQTVPPWVQLLVASTRLSAGAVARQTTTPGATLAAFNGLRRSRPQPLHPRRSAR
eukprot:1513456-Heterocapsa_arctica.AAC.1